MLSGLLLALCYSVVAADVVRHPHGIHLLSSRTDPDIRYRSPDAIGSAAAFQVPGRWNQMQPHIAATRLHQQQPSAYIHPKMRQHNWQHPHTSPQAPPHNSNYHEAIYMKKQIPEQTNADDGEKSSANIGDTVKHQSHRQLHENGAAHNEEQRSKSGYHDRETYAKKDDFNAGESGSHDNNDHTNYYSNSNEHQGAGQSESKNHANHAEGVHGIKGGQYAQKKQHKKGSKTLGYHNVFHKDEYKKDHTFYDEAHIKGDYEKYGHEHEQHAEDEGDAKKGSHSESATHNVNAGKAGHIDNGNHEQHDEGYTMRHGTNNNQAHDKAYATKGGQVNSEIHKHKQMGNHHP